MTVSLPDARSLSDEVLEALRLRALHACELGFTEADVADVLGVCRETVSSWWSAYCHGGVDALPHDRTGRPLGAGRLLSEDQADRIQQLLRTHSPEQLGIAAPLWTRRAVADLIHQEFNLSLAIRTVGLYLQRWGFTAKRPSRHSREEDPEDIRQWLEETYPAIEARAQREGATIFWGDEVGVAADEQPARGYAPRGGRATVDVPARHDRLEVFYLPSHAPERNPDEYLNDDLKEKVNAKGLPHNKGEVRSRIQQFMQRLLHLPEHVMSYFLHPSVQYAASLDM